MEGDVDGLRFLYGCSGQSLLVSKVGLRLGKAVVIRCFRLLTSWLYLRLFRSDET